MNKEEMREVIREERRRQSERAVMVVLGLIGFAVLLLIANFAATKYADATDPVKGSRYSTPARNP